MEGKMKAIVKNNAGPGAELMDVDIPTPGPGQVLIKVKSTSICGSDLHIYKWNNWAEKNVKLPQIMGHEVAGKVIALGENVKSVKEGDFVSAETHIPCGHCYQCKTGNRHICENMKILGVHTDGVFAEYAILEEVDVWHNDPSIPAESASIQEPLGNAIDTIRAGDVTGKEILITGAGPVGLLAVGVARAFGATKIIVSEPNEYRRKIAKKMGADLTLDPINEDLLSLVIKNTDGRGVDFTAEMSGNKNAIQQGLKSVRPGGSMALLGLPDDPISIDLTQDLIFKAVNLIGITGREMFKTWYIAGRLLKENRLNLSPVITHTFPLADFEKGMKLMEEGNCGKIILKP